MKTSSKVILAFTMCLPLSLNMQSVWASDAVNAPASQSNSSLASTQIVGGQEAQSDDWPWMTAYVITFESISTRLTVDGSFYESTYFSNTPSGTQSGALVSCGKGDGACADAQNKVCLIERGEINFSEKAQNCENSGGVAAIIYNNEEGQINGTLGTDFAGTIPVIAITRADGLILLDKTGTIAEVTVSSNNNIQQDASCGASFLGDKWVLVAAHCVDSPDAPYFKMNVGEYDLSDGAENATAIANIYIHPQYNADDIDYDIALVELVESLDAPAIQLASQATTDQYAMEHSPALVAGWGGRTGYAPGEGPTSDFPDILHQVELNLTTNAECRSILANSIGTSAQNVGISDQMICATQPGSGQGTCQGDSGGPLIIQTGSGPQQVGIVSWGIGCAESGYPGVFTRVAQFTDWIETITHGIAVQQIQDFGVSPVAISQSSTLNISNNSEFTVDLDFSITGSSTFTLQNHNCTNIAVGESCSLDVSFSPNQSGELSAYLSISTNNNAVLTSEALLKGQAVNSASTLSGVAGPTNTSVTWYSGGDANWLANAIDSGVQSGNINNNQQSILTAYIQGPGTLNFDWRVSSEENEDDPNEPYDALYVYVNNTLYDFISGVDGEFESFGDISLENDTSIVTWIYSKDPATIDGEDKGYVRNVVFTPTAVPSTPSTPTTSSSSSGGGSIGYLWLMLIVCLLLFRKRQFLPL